MTRASVKILAILAWALWAPLSLAQDDEAPGLVEEGRYQETMESLAEHLGALHHLRGGCFEAERQKWRDYMQEMVRLEDPSSDRKNAMVARFNKGYADAQRRYPDCNRSSAIEAERIAALAAKLSDAIASAAKY